MKKILIGILIISFTLQFQIQVKEIVTDETTTALTTVDPQKCIEEKCPKEWDACQKDSKCIPALQDCEKKCGQKETCWKMCLAQKGDQAADNVAKCAAANHCLGEEKEEEKSTALVTVDPEKCIQEKCPKEWDACQKDSKCIPALQDCEKKCGQKETCWKMCLAQKGDQAADNVAKCAANHCLGEEKEEKQTAIALADPRHCIEQKCPDQLQACKTDPKCFPAIQDCEKQCKSDATCFNTCLSQKGNQDAVNLIKCAHDNHCFDHVEKKNQISTALVTVDPQKCIQEKCPKEWDACQKDSKCIPALQDCEKKCGQKETCWKMCLAQKGDQAADNVAKCAAANHCLGEIKPFDECMQKSCELAASACEGDNMCEFLTSKCREQKNGNWMFNIGCLIEKAAFNPRVEEWFRCAGESKCI